MCVCVCVCVCVCACVCVEPYAADTLSLVAFICLVKFTRTPDESYQK